MLRAISEIAAAMTVWSPLENPAPAARSRPCWRACTTSTSAAIGRRTSSPTVHPSREPAIVAATHAAPASPRSAAAAAPETAAFTTVLVEECQAFFQVQRRGHTLEGEAQLHHRERHLGLNPDDDGLGAAQPSHMRDVAQRAHGKGIHDVERGHIHDHAARTEPADALDQGLAQVRE